MSNEQIRMVFQLVKQVGSFPNTTYVLSMDKGVVCRALEEIQRCSGEDYLEKIVQIPFNIPELDKNKVHTLLFHKLDEILEKKANVEFNKEHWSKVYQGCIYPYIQTIRDVNRIVNSFQFKFNMIYSEVNFSDLIGITTLEVLQPCLLDWIIENRQKLCGGSYDYNGVVWAEQDQKKKEYNKIFKENGIEDENAVQAVASLFPKFDKEINHQYESISENDIKGQLRIADVERFELYFKLDISEIKVHRKVIIDSVKRLGEQELDSLIKKINIDGNIIPYLEALRGKIDEIPYDRIGLIVRILYKNKPLFIGLKSKSFLEFSAERYAEFCINPLIEKLSTTKERYHIYNEIIKCGDINDLSSICADINRVELAYGRLAGKELRESEQLVSIRELESLEKQFAVRLKELAEGDHIFETESLLFIKYLWENFDCDECKKYFNKKLQEDKYKLKFICSQATEWSGTGGRGWSFTKSNYQDYVDENEVYDIINNYNKYEMFKDFTNIELVKLASFVLNKGKNEMNHVSESIADSLVEKWKEQNMVR